MSCANFSQHPPLCEIFAQHFLLCEIFAQHIPCAKFSHNTSLVLICFCANFQKCMLSVHSQNLSANFTGMRTLCEFIFRTNFQSHALCLGIPQECEIHTSSLKVEFSYSKAKDSSHVFFKGNPLPSGRGAPNFKFSS